MDSQFRACDLLPDNIYQYYDKNLYPICVPRTGICKYFSPFSIYALLFMPMRANFRNAHFLLPRRIIRACHLVKIPQPEQAKFLGQICLSDVAPPGCLGLFWTSMRRSQNSRPRMKSSLQPTRRNRGWIRNLILGGILG